MKLRLKILIYIILTISIVFVVSVGFVNYRYWNNTKDMALGTADLYAKQSAMTAQSILTADLKTVQALEQIFVSYRKFDKDVRTEFYNQFLVDILENNPNFLAVWVNWELSAIDPEWTMPYGRERTVAFLNSGSIKISVDSADLEGDVPGSPYYLMKSGVEENLLTDPYFYTYTQDTGSTFLETSIGKRIIVGDDFVGAVGVDISLQRFQNLLSELKPFENSKIIIISNDGTIVAYEDESIIGRKINKVFPEYNSERLIEKIKDGIDFSFPFKDKEGNEEYLSFYPIKFEGSTMSWSLGFVVSNKVIVKDFKRDFILMIAISVVSLIFIAIIIWTVLSLIVGPIEKTSQTLEALSKGNVSDVFKIEYDTKDELGRMAKAANILIDSLKRTQMFAIEIGKGNLNIEYELLSQSDVLGQSLLEMRDNLLKATKEEQKRSDEAQKLAWTQNGITEINEILRERSDNLETLSNELIKFLVRYTESVQGGFYLIEAHEGKEAIYLKAAYAYDRKKELNAEIEIGEGLIGRAVKEKQTVVIQNLPEGYLYVRSGLGDKSPDNLVIVPLIFEESVLGALELAGFNKYSDFKVAYLEQIAIRITSSVSVLLKNIETANLLKESQLQTATFEMKEKQFMRQRRKLSDKQNELEMKSAQVETSLKVLKEVGLYLELDPDKKIIDTNDFLPKIFKVEKKELIGKDFEQITHFVKGSKIWVDKFWEDVFNGETRKKTTNYKWNDFEMNIIDVYFRLNTQDSFKVIIIGIN